MMPPTTPPAIAPVFELPLEDDGTGEVGAIVDWLLLAEVGTKEAVPVTSGESVTKPRVRKGCGSLTKIHTTNKLRRCQIPGTGLQGKG